jgi:hypothetical protein
VTSRPSVRVQQQTELDTKETSGRILCWFFASRSNYRFHFLDKSKPHSHSDSHLTKTLRNIHNYPLSAPPDTLRQENTVNQCAKRTYFSSDFGCSSWPVSGDEPAETFGVKGATDSRSTAPQSSPTGPQRCRPPPRVVERWSTQCLLSISRRS